MVGLHHLLEARLAYVRRDLEEALDRADGLGVDDAPAPGMRTLGGQLQEILATEVQVCQMLDGKEPTPFRKLEAEMKRPSLAEYRATLGEVRAETLALLARLSEDQLAETLAMEEGSWEGLGLASVPRAEVFRSLAAHEWYHAGQIVTYAWAAGRNPYKV